MLLHVTPKKICEKTRCGRLVMNFLFSFVPTQPADDKVRCKICEKSFENTIFKIEVLFNKISCCSVESFVINMLNIPSVKALPDN